MAVTGDRIASDALRWRGQSYVYGGDAARPGDWDCSSFVSYVLGHDLRLGLPGGRWGAPGFPPNAHGPVVESYASWRGAVTVQSPTRGDLVCFVGEGADGHIGIVLGPDQMVSALDTIQGTVVTPIQGYGPPGAPIVYRRVLGTVAGTVAQQATQAASNLSPLGAVLVVVGMVGMVLAGAVLTGTVVALGGAWLVKRAADA